MAYLQDLVWNAGYVGSNMYIEFSVKGRLYTTVCLYTIVWHNVCIYIYDLVCRQPAVPVEWPQTINSLPPPYVDVEEKNEFWRRGAGGFR